MTRAVDAGLLQFPEWFPSALRENAEEQFTEAIKKGASQDILNRLRRLIAHPEMKKVWNELYRKSRTDKREFFYPANPIKGYPGSADEWRRYMVHLRSQGGSVQLRQAQEIEQILNERVDLLPISRANSSAQFMQDIACKLLLTMAMVFARCDLTVVTIKDLKKVSEHYRNKARRFQDEAFIMRTHRFEEKDARKLEHAAQAYLKRAEGYSLDPYKILLVKRKRGDRVVRAYLLRLVQTNKELFGRQLSGCIAIMTNAVFETNFSGSHIREMTRGKFRSGI
jgi:hypothetical protein